MATFNTKYFTEKQQEHRKKEKELSQRYHSWEHIPGESWKDFKQRISGKTVKLSNETDRIYRAWEKMPDETEKQFRKRLSSKKAK